MIGAVLVGLATVCGMLDTFGDPYRALCTGLLVTVTLGLFVDAAS